MRRGEGLVDPVLIDRCVERLRDLLEAAARDVSINQSGVLHLVVVDPAAPVVERDFETAILAEYSFGKPRNEWDFDYAGAAREKARVSWVHGCDSQALHALRPHRLTAGQSLLWGSVNLDGIVVAISGAIPEYDEALSGTVAMLVRAEAKRELQARLRDGALILGRPR